MSDCERATLLDSKKSTSAIKEKLLLVDLFVVDFLASLCTSAPLSFFGRVVLEKHGTNVQSVLILQALKLSLTVFSIVFGKLQPRIGSKRLLISGVLLIGLGGSGLGALNHIDDVWCFTTVGIFLRLLEGVGDAALSISSLTILCNKYPENVSKVMGIYNLTVGSAVLLGPVLSGVLYDHFGMTLPALITGGMVLVTVPFHFFAIENDIVSDYGAQRGFNYLRLLAKPNAAITAASYACTFGILSYYDVALTTYLQGDGYSTAEVGLAMLMCALGYVVFCPITGFVVEIKKIMVPCAIVLGTTCFASFMLLLISGSSKAVVYVASLLVGASCGVAVVPVLEYLISITSDDEQPVNAGMEINSSMSGLLYSLFGVGTVLVPIAASAMQQAVGSFAEEMFQLSMVEYAIAFSLLAMFLKTNINCTQRMAKLKRIPCPSSDRMNAIFSRIMVKNLAEITPH